MINHVIAYNNKHDADVLHGPTSPVVRYSPISDGSVAKWTHPAMLKLLKVPKDMLPQRNRCLLTSPFLSKIAV